MKLPKGLSKIDAGKLTVWRLYDTDIVTVDRVNNTVTLCNGGWKTKHTKKCINLVCNEMGLHLYQKDFTWYIEFRDKVLEFNDGINLSI